MVVFGPSKSDLIPEDRGKAALELHSVDSSWVVRPWKGGNLPLLQAPGQLKAKWQPSPWAILSLDTLALVAKMKRPPPNKKRG